MTEPNPTPTSSPAPGTPILEARGVGKAYGGVVALQDVSMAVTAGEVTCVLGDNGAGKSTLIKILSGAHAPSAGELLVDGVETRFDGPRAALDAGIATVYQDLAMVPLMPVWRNFFLGREETVGKGLLSRLDHKTMRRVTKDDLKAMGIDLKDVNQPIGTLSGGERQCVAIARAIHFGGRALILDEPTAALGVKQSEVVLRSIVEAKRRGIGVVLITHNPNHAYPVGDHFLVLNHGTSMGYFAKADLTVEQLATMMAGDPLDVEGM
ncbi:MAG: ATP-binding cassette domain-containing protein [Propionibacteriaceae bacterium]|jgi:simple sugar transport system ATP-binding protein|nr:ATP-binding cassette domain-containing protein [Propionibacteriaceae bacterium]